MWYFNPNVWGTVSDWFIVAVTSVTAYYLYQTLKSQKDVQKTQNQLFEIEKIRFKESIKPLFTYSQSKNEFKTDEKYFGIVTIEISNESSNTAHDIEINYTERENIIRIMIPIDYLFAPQKHLKKGDKPYLLHFLIKEKPISVEFISFEVHYKDVSDATYKQNVSCIYDDILTIVSGQAEAVSFINK